MHLRASLLHALAALGTALSLGCNFIFNPDGDGVFRCDNTDDCNVPLLEYLEDERGQPSCAAPGGAGGGFTQSQDNKVCSVVDKEDVDCDPSGVGADTPLGKAYAEAEANALVYDCTTDQKGSLGCPPTASGSCNDGLVVRKYTSLTGSKDDPNAEEVEVCAKKGEDVVAPNDALLGQDVLDQHCRSYFCEESFVCTLKKRCARCDPDKAYGDGGCGDLYLAGAKSTVYVDGDCPDLASVKKTEFGPVPAAPAP